MTRLKVSPKLRQDMREQLARADVDLAGCYDNLALIREMSSETGRVVDELRNTLNTLIQALRTAQRVAQRIGL
jgi:hypothetical protein